MSKITKYNNQLSSNENFLLSILNKIMHEYRALLDHVRQTKPFKIIEIVRISDVPGETLFLIQIVNKNCLLKLTAGELLNQGYDLKDFSEFNAEIIRHAAQGKLVSYLQYSTNYKPKYIIDSKRFDKTLQEYIFTIKTDASEIISRTSSEISLDKDLLANLNLQDIYDIAYSRGTETILKEKTALLLAKNK